MATREERQQCFIDDMAAHARKRFGVGAGLDEARAIGYLVVRIVDLEQRVEELEKGEPK